jgi:ABC-2 type transport system ATP-binding protein
MIAPAPDAPAPVSAAPPLPHPRPEPPAIYVRDLRKVYTVHEREAGVLASLRSLVRRRSRDVAAVDGIDVSVRPGEIVGFLGPNGAGKTTTLKMLSGLLYPSSGEVRVLGHVPWRRERAYLRQITLVMGNRNQLVWDIPAADSFELNRAIYRIPWGEYRRTLDELTALLDLSALLNKPVRGLSLGERMKCEVAAALLHRPRVLFLDEPTIGLDVTMQRRLRHFVGEYNRRHGATVLLTSHYMADVEALCKRVLVIHHGRLLFDGPLTALVERFSPHKTIVVELDEAAGVGPVDLSPFGEVLAVEEGRVTLRVPKAATAQVTGRLLASVPIADLTVADPPIEEVIEQVFAQGSPDGGAPPGGPEGAPDGGAPPGGPEGAPDGGPRGEAEGETAPGAETR